MPEGNLYEAVTAVREDVAFIRAKIEVLPDYESRLRALERFRAAVPSVSVLALVVSVGSIALAYFS